MRKGSATRGPSSDWERWFAWRPVLVIEDRKIFCRWLCFVYRRIVWHNVVGSTRPFYDSRTPGKRVVVHILYTTKRGIILARLQCAPPVAVAFDKLDSWMSMGGISVFTLFALIIVFGAAAFITWLTT